MKKSRILSILVIVVTAALVWYLFIKKEDYIIRFQVKTSPGTMLTMVEDWNFINNAKGNFRNKITEKNPFEYLAQELDYNGHKLHLSWEFTSINDSLSKVRVGISEKDKSIYNRLTVPFKYTSFKSASLDLIKNFKEETEQFLEEKFKVRSVQLDTVPGWNFAFVALKDVKMSNKGMTMKDNNNKILSFLTENDIPVAGYPIITIDRWDKIDNVIDLKFGFPIESIDSFPKNDLIKSRHIPTSKAIKAVINGNYIYSDRAWFAIDEYAKRRNIQLKTLPIEVFKDNPFFGGNDMEWVAEIYMPISD